MSWNEFVNPLSVLIYSILCQISSSYSQLRLTHQKDEEIEAILQDVKNLNNTLRDLKVWQQQTANKTDHLQLIPSRQGFLMLVTILIITIIFAMTLLNWVSFRSLRREVYQLMHQCYENKAVLERAKHYIQVGFTEVRSVRQYLDAAKEWADEVITQRVAEAVIRYRAFHGSEVPDDAPSSPGGNASDSDEGHDGQELALMRFDQGDAQSQASTTETTTHGQDQ
ncbi:MAG: hypothetical protein Q9159_005635 [Coniocarpon cinnabarinum]